MDSSKSIATSRQLSYLIVALGLIALFLAWAESAEDPRWRVYSYMAKIIVVSNILNQEGWISGHEITPYALASTFSDDFTQYQIAATNHLCAKTPSEESAQLNQPAGFSIDYTFREPYVPPLSHFDVRSKDLSSTRCSQLRELLLSRYPSLPSADTIPNARLFTHINFPGENVFGCSFIIFRGTDDQSYNIPALYIRGVRREIHGSAVYTVFFNNRCLGQNPFDPPIPFMLIDDTQVTGSWYSSITDWAERIVWKKAVLDKPGDWIDDPRFDMRSVLNRLQHEFLDDLVQLIPDIVYIENVEALRTRIIADAALKEGILYTQAHWEKAVDQLFNMAQEKPNYLGITLEAKLAINIAPMVMFWLTVLLWHSVRRIDFSKRPFDEPWILTDIKGRIEGVLAVLWMLLLLASVAVVFWAVMVYNDASLPPLGFLQMFWRFPESRDLLLSTISWKATFGGLFLVVGFLPLIGVMHIILREESRLYSGLIVRMRLRRKRPD